MFITQKHDKMFKLKNMSRIKVVLFPHHHNTRLRNYLGVYNRRAGLH